MKNKNLIIGLFVMFGVILMAAPGSRAQTCNGSGTNFVDLNGDGFNDNAPDYDGDGIPNGLDPDYIKNAQDGSGYQHQKGNLNKTATANKMMNKFQKRNKFATANSYKFQNRFNRVNGSSGGSGTGICDGSGPNGESGNYNGSGPHGQGRQH